MYSLGSPNTTGNTNSITPSTSISFFSKTMKVGLKQPDLMISGVHPKTLPLLMRNTNRTVKF